MPRKFQLQLLISIGLILFFAGRYFDIPHFLNLGMVVTGLWIYFYRDVLNQQEIVGLTDADAEKRTKFNRIALPICGVLFILAGIYFAIFGDFTFTLWPKQ